MTSPTTPRNTLSEIMLVARSKTDFVFIFFILGTFLVLKGGWGTPKVGLVQKTIGKVIGRCVGNLGNIVCTSNPNNGQGHQNAQGLAAMRITATQHRPQIHCICSENTFTTCRHRHRPSIFHKQPSVFRVEQSETENSTCA